MIQRLQKILIDLTGREDIVLTPKTRIDKDMGLSSLSVVGLICAVEDEFDVEISNSAIRSFKTVGDVLKYLEKNT